MAIMRAAQRMQAIYLGSFEIYMRTRGAGHGVG